MIHGDPVVIGLWHNLRRALARDWVGELEECDDPDEDYLREVRLKEIIKAARGLVNYVDAEAVNPDAIVSPIEDLRTSGLLWLINATTFHPRGYALALHMRGGRVTGWSVQGDGSEPWKFDGEMDSLFEAAEATLRAHAKGSQVPRSD